MPREGQAAELAGAVHRAANKNQAMGIISAHRHQIENIKIKKKKAANCGGLTSLSSCVIASSPKLPGPCGSAFSLLHLSLPVLTPPVCVQARARVPDDGFCESPVTVTGRYLDEASPFGTYD
jgi:hypothetical protein